MGVTFRELFLVLHGFRTRRERIPEVLAALAAGPLLPLRVELLYRQDRDLALAKLAFQYDQPAHIEEAQTRLARTGLEVIDPVGMPPASRRRFHELLARFPIRVEHRELGEAVAALAGKLPRVPAARGQAPSPAPHRPAPGTPAADREPTSPAKDRPAPGSPAVFSPRSFDPDSVEIGNTAASPGAYRHVRPRRDRLQTVPGRPWARSNPPPVPPRPRAAAGGAKGADMPSRPLLARGTQDLPDPDAVEAHGRSAIPTIEVQLRWGDEWVAGRLRYLSDLRARVATTASPRSGDAIAISLRLGAARLEVSGVVDEVSRARSLDQPMATGFSVVFDQHPEQQRALAAFIRASAERGVKFSPPPPRRARFPLAWPIVVTASSDRPRRVTARDISHGGMFLQHAGLPGDQLGFAIPLDRVEPVIRGRMRLVRAVSPSVAMRRGFASGAGAEICTFAAGDSARYDRFVDRIRRRNERFVIVGAAPGRRAALTASLRAVGYAVRSSSDPSEFVDLIGTGVQRPNLAIVDRGISVSGSDLELIGEVLQDREVEYLSPGDESVQEVRRQTDRLLGIL